MPIKLSKMPVASRDDLKEIADARLEEAHALLQSKHYAGAVYLGGHAVECYLKVAICVTLGWESLLGTFKVHDLEGLMLYSGFDVALRANASVSESFTKIARTWKVAEVGDVRYRRPDEFDERTARVFLQYVTDPKTGVVPWLRKKIS